MGVMTPTLEELAAAAWARDRSDASYEVTGHLEATDAPAAGTAR
ncbi:MAG: hypothetical protein JWO83_979 [Caulobacteraceae bacterium]|nr:hypothetical protein [Caulobacteraceae bacterium]